jgi:hypothetical protein
MREVPPTAFTGLCLSALLPPSAATASTVAMVGLGIQRIDPVACLGHNRSRYINRYSHDATCSFQQSFLLASKVSMK